MHVKLTPEIRSRQRDGCEKFAEGTWADEIGPGGGFFTLPDRLIYEGTRKQAEFLNKLQKIATEKTRLKIPVLQIEEGTHGLMCSGGTIFPEGLAIGSTWNMEGRCVAGDLVGTQLEPLHGLMTEWYGWYATYPQTTLWER